MSHSYTPSHDSAIPRRSLPYEAEPGFYEAGRLWLYGNVRLLHSPLAWISGAGGLPSHTKTELDDLEKRAEQAVLDGKILVAGIHSPAHQRVALVPLRWGAPRIVVMSGGFRYHLGPNLDQEPFRAARLWRFCWDAKVDLAVSRRAPDKLPTYARHNPSLDRLIRQIAEGTCPGFCSPYDPLSPVQYWQR